MTMPTYVPGTGDLIWTEFDPTKGREQAGRRPALGEIQKDLQRLRRARKNHDLDDIARDKRELAEDRADLRKDVASPSI